MNPNPKEPPHLYEPRRKQAEELLNRYGVELA